MDVLLTRILDLKQTFVRLFRKKIRKLKKDVIKAQDDSGTQRKRE